MFTGLQQREVREQDAGVKSAIRTLPLNAVDALLLGLLIIPTFGGEILIV